MNRYFWKLFLIRILLINILIPVQGMTQTGPGTSQSTGTITIIGSIIRWAKEQL